VIEKTLSMGAHGGIGDPLSSWQTANRLSTWNSLTLH
jgi:hypothetical protein